MKNNLKTITIGMLLIFLVGCTPAQTPAPTAVPTMDPAVIIEMAVKTVEAKITQAAIDNPSATPLPSITPIPSATATPLPPTITSTPLATITKGPSPTPVSEVAMTAIASGLSAKFLYASIYGLDNGGGPNDVTPNQRFGLAFGFKNTGTIPWNGGYKVALLKAVKEFTGQQGAFLDGPVQPGEKTEVNLWGFGSEDVGQHVWYYQLYTPNGVPVPGGLAVFYYQSH